jgi:hypothetical protein
MIAGTELLPVMEPRRSSGNRDLVIGHPYSSSTEARASVARFLSK